MKQRNLIRISIKRDTYIYYIPFQFISFLSLIEKEYLIIVAIEYA